MKVIYEGFHMPNKWAFQIPRIMEILVEICKGKSCLFPFAGITRIFACGEGTVYIDIKKEIEYDCEGRVCIAVPDIVGDCKEVMKDWIDQEVTNQFDVAILDPPFSAHQAIRQYGNQMMSDIKVTKDLVADLVKPKGIVVTFGFNSTGMGKVRNFIKRELHIFNHGGNHNDTLMLIEQKKVIPTLDKYMKEVQEENGTDK